MTVENQQCVVSYTVGAGEGEFPTTFKFLENAHLLVTLIRDDVPTVYTLDVDYTVSGAGDPEPGGTVYLVSPPDFDFTLTIERQTPVIQPINFITNGQYSPTVVERQADRLIMIEQENRHRLETLEAGEVVTPAPGGGASVIVTKTFTTDADAVEDTFPLTVALGDGLVPVSVQVSRAENLDDGAAIFNEPPGVDWSPASGSFSVKFLSGLEPDTNYRITFEVLVTESDSVEPVSLVSPDASIDFEVVAAEDTIPSSAAIVMLSADGDYTLTGDTIEDGTTVPQRLLIFYGQDGGGQVIINASSRILLTGANFSFNAGNALGLLWDGSAWNEITRNVHYNIDGQVFEPGTAPVSAPVANVPIDCANAGSPVGGVNTLRITDLSGDVLMTALPTLTVGVTMREGTEITIVNYSDVYKITLQDEGTLPGSGLHLSTNTVDLIGGSSIRLRYRISNWYEVARAILV